MNVYEIRIDAEDGREELQYVAAKTVAVALEALKERDQFAAEKVTRVFRLCTLDHICPAGEPA